MKISMEDLLEEFRATTSKMTQEKYDYLRETESLSPVKLVRLAILKKNGANNELLARSEYAYLFENYANHFYKWWKDNEWGTKENESLYDFADGALVQEIMDRQKEKDGITR